MLHVAAYACLFLSLLAGLAHPLRPSSTQEVGMHWCKLHCQKSPKSLGPDSMAERSVRIDAISYNTAQVYLGDIARKADNHWGSAQNTHLHVQPASALLSGSLLPAQDFQLCHKGGGGSFLRLLPDLRLSRCIHGCEPLALILQLAHDRCNQEQHPSWWNETRLLDVNECGQLFGGFENFQLISWTMVWLGIGISINISVRSCLQTLSVYKKELSVQQREDISKISMPGFPMFHLIKRTT